MTRQAPWLTAEARLWAVRVETAGLQVCEWVHQLSCAHDHRLQSKPGVYRRDGLVRMTRKGSELVAN